LESTKSDRERSYDIHGAVSIKLVGRDPVSNIIDKTLSLFRSAPGVPDLTLVLGEYPSQEWKPTGTLVGDRILYDINSRTTTDLRTKVTEKLEKSETEYVLAGDLRIPGEPVTVYVPNLRKPVTPGRSFRHNLRRGHLRRALLAETGNPFGMQQVAHQAERITEAVIEPFLFYRLPAKELSLIHATAFCSMGKATLFAGSANIGKSTLALQFVKENRAFLGDTLVILSEKGEVLPYPGLVKLHGGHLAAFPELRDRLVRGTSGIGASLLRGELSSSPGDAIELLPQHEMTELFDDVTVPKHCEVEKVFLVRRGSFSDAKSEEVEAETVARALSVDMFWEIEAAPWRNGQFVYSPSAATGRDFAQESMELHAKIREIIRKGITGAKCHRLSLPIEAPVTRALSLMALSQGR